MDRRIEPDFLSKSARRATIFIWLAFVLLLLRHHERVPENLRNERSNRPDMGGLIVYCPDACLTL